MASQARYELLSSTVKVCCGLKNFVRGRKPFEIELPFATTFRKQALKIFSSDSLYYLVAEAQRSLVPILSYAHQLF